MISTLVTLIVGLLLIGLASYVAKVFFPEIARIVNIVCLVLAVLLLIYCIYGFVGGGSSVALGAMTLA